MKQYTQDYTKVSEAESHLYAAQQLNVHDDPIEAWKHIEDARRLLQEYLSQDNMVEDPEVADGWVRASDIVATVIGSDLAKVSEHKVERTGPKIVKHGKIDRQYAQQLDGVGDPSCPLYRKHIRITGTFDQLGMSRDDVAAACQRLGAKKVSEGIAKGMDIVIMGNNAGPSKMERIKEWQADGYKITVLSQYDLKKIFEEYPEALQE